MRRDHNREFPARFPKDTLMLTLAKKLAKGFFVSAPAQETRETRNLLTELKQEFNGIRLPFAPTHQGDLIHRLITRHEYANCIETGFATGSTAAYMLAATKPKSGKVISVDNSQGGVEIEIGKKCIVQSGMQERHEFYAEDSASVLRRLCKEQRKFDFVFLDGWKTFDHLAYEIYLIDDMLNDSGIVFFDDAYMSGVRQAINLTKRYYGYREISYDDYGEDWRMKIYLRLTCRSVHRPYRALRKVIPTYSQERKINPYFYSKL